MKNNFRKDFAVFIMTHNRAGNIKTLNTLNRSGYTGPVYLLIDDGDPMMEKYIELYGEDMVVIFNKDEAQKYFDLMDNFDGQGVPTFARNILYKTAKNMGFQYFLAFEDDYTAIQLRFVVNNVLKSAPVKNFDRVIDAMIDFIDDTGAETIAFSQGGDLIGGINNQMFKQGLSRKAMNSFFFNVDKPVIFEGRFNDDVNSYVNYGKRGVMFFTISLVQIVQMMTQQNKGGITDAYKAFGTYVKSFYSVMIDPSAVKIADMGVYNRRIHHRVYWDNAVPKILNEKWKKV